ncbi:MAG: radical SAM protein, partial [Deltaproteobacteria bacterium]|nr:radical SAM protein [Deltaproteobacteria bacterium]
MSDIVLVHPPVAKPGEAPAGIARLAGYLRAAGVGCRLLDLNLEGLDFLLAQRFPVTDTWSRRAFAKQAENRAFLSSPAGFTNFARYRRAVEDLNRVISMVGRRHRLTLTLSDYQDPGCTPLASRDLLASAEAYRENIYFPFFSSRLKTVIEQEQPATIGFSLSYLSQAPNVFAMIGFCRDHFPGLKIVLGGGLVTSWLSRPGRKPSFGGLVDHLVAGPGEAALFEIVKGAGVEPGADAEPDYREFPRSEYLAPSFILPYAASSGCYWNRCAFCPEKAENNPYRALPAAPATAGINKLVREYRPALVHLLDNALSPALLRALIR